MKKIFLSIFTLMMLLVGATTGAYASTVIVMPPKDVGNYNDFGNQIDLTIDTTGTHASQYKVYWSKGYNATSGFQSKYVSATPNFYDRYNRPCVKYNFAVPTQGYWTVMVVSVGANGVTSKPFKMDIYVLR